VAIQPLAMVRSVVQLTGERAAKRVAHWQAVVISACEQCGRTRVPEVAPIQSITTWLASQRAVAGGQVRLLLTPRAGQRLHDLPRSTEVTLLAGPEGGLAPEEEAQALAAGFTGVRLGPRVLRTETAALAAIAALQTLWGDF
jgi:16S rRNA (uracil1498-N3)-methyltransferase